jgi:protein ImuB
VLLWLPEPVFGPAGMRPPATFRWRGRDHAAVVAEGPERIAPEWWLDDPAWRAGQRDYWRVVTDRGEALWLFVTRDSSPDARSGDWFCQGSFC